MLWDPTRKPALRPVEAFRLPGNDEAALALRDRSGLSDAVVSFSEPALHVLAMLDGTRTCDRICRDFTTMRGRPLSPDTLQSLLDVLEQAHLLEGPGFEEFYRGKLKEYRNAGRRPMRDAAALGLVDGAAGRVFEDCLNGWAPPALPGPVRGLVAPHLDYGRGKPCYAAAYATLRERAVPDCVVILGTNHFGRSRSVVATANDFVTPLGTTHVDRDFLERIEAACGPLRTYELDHAREHSIELQVAWLQYLFGAGSSLIVPFLCSDPCGAPDTASNDGKAMDLQGFARTLGDLIAEDDRDVLILAGADLSHIGRAFGDERVLDDAFLCEARQRDMRALGMLEINNPVDFVRVVAEENNPTRVCSAGCLFALAVALQGVRGTILRYHQAVDEPSQTCVTCAAVAFT